jgi:hypothetical protein
MPTSRVTTSTESTSTESISRDTELSNVTTLRGEPVLFAPTDIEPIAESEGELTIDCDCCALRNTAACDDCVVSFLLEREPDDAVVIDADEARAMRMLERAGLVPTLRFSTQAG